MAKSLLETKSNKVNLEFLKVGFDIKSFDDSDENYFIVKGYASTFGNIDAYNDVVMPGAFKKSLKSSRKVRVLWQHDWSEPIGSVKTIKEDKVGLYVEIMLPKTDTFVAGRVWPQLKAGSIDSFSIGYTTKKSQMDEDSGVRKLIEVDLWEFSLVTIPANDQAVVTAIKTLEQAIEAKDLNALDKIIMQSRKDSQSLPDEAMEDIKELYKQNGRECPIEKGFTSHIAEHCNTITECSKFLKNFGLSNSEANTLISKIKASSETREEPEQSRNDDVRSELKTVVDSLFSTVTKLAIRNIKENKHD